MTEHLKVFISYSHDSSDHKLWISKLAEKLQRSGVDAILDQWELTLDEDSTQFIESGVRDSDRVLVICTDSYVRKANSGEDGVGYEPTILTKEIVENIGINKFIPIIRQTLWEEKTPTFLQKQVSIDFTDDEQFDAKFEELLHDERLLVLPLQRPDVPHIESFRIKNYRALRDIELKDLKPLTVFLGANGSGKSTIIDVFAFLSECFTLGLRQAWNNRGGIKELRTLGCDGPIEFELKYRERTKITNYHVPSVY